MSLTVIRMAISAALVGSVWFDSLLLYIFSTLLSNTNKSVQKGEGENTTKCTTCSTGWARGKAR